jgi:hypothetical protein
MSERERRLFEMKRGHAPGRIRKLVILWGVTALMVGGVIVALYHFV